MEAYSFLELPLMIAASRKCPVGTVLVTDRQSPTPTSQLWKGLFKNYNTIEQFRSPQAKKELFDSMVSQVCIPRLSFH
jgi:hypothetical protein